MVIGMATLWSTGAARATLITESVTVNYSGAERNLIYDTDLDITWLDYSNDNDTWDNQVAWAGGLSFDIGGITYDNGGCRRPLTGDGFMALTEQPREATT